MKLFISAIHIGINAKGRNEQEKQYLFPALYGQKALTRNEKGNWQRFENELKAGKFRVL